MHRFVLALTLAGVLAGPATADVITFSGLGGSNASPFPASYTEGIFTVTPVSGTVLQGISIGAPAPSVLGGPVGVGSVVTSTIEVTRTGGGLFTFEGLDLTSVNGGTSFTLAGFLGGSPTFSQAVNQPSSFTTFSSITAASGSQAFDRLRITGVPGGGTSSFNIDNIRATAVSPPPVPEPATLAVFGLLAAGGVAGWRRRATA